MVKLSIILKYVLLIIFIIIAAIAIARAFRYTIPNIFNDMPVKLQTYIGLK